MWECLYANVSKNLASIEGSYLTFERPRKKTLQLNIFEKEKKKKDLVQESILNLFEQIKLSYYS